MSRRCYTAGGATVPVAIVAVLCLAELGCVVHAPVPIPTEDFALDFTTGRLALPERPVIVFFVDGLQNELLEEMAAVGELPKLKKYLLDRAARPEVAVAGLPTITYANAVTMITGRQPGHHGVLGNRWFDRRRLINRNYESLATMGRVNIDIEVPTLYERLDDRLTAVIMMQVNRGVTLPVNVFPIEGGLQTGVAWGLGWALLADRLLARRVREVGQYAAEFGRWPDFLLVYLPGVDHVGHEFGRDSPQYRAAVANIDECVGGILAALAEAGVLERFTVVLTADHGHIPTPAANSLLLESWLPERLGLRVDSAGPAEDRVPLPVQRFRHFREQSAVLVRQGDRLAQLHVRAGRPESLADWSTRPSLEEILTAHLRLGDLRQARRALPGADTMSLPDALLTEPGVGLVAVRADPDTVRIFSRVGSAEIRRSHSAHGRCYAYRVLTGHDPLGNAEYPAAARLCDGQPHSDADWLAATAASRHPDVVPQLPEMFDHHRAGDLVIFAAAGWDFSPVNLGGHGGIEREEMLIPFWWAGPDIVPGQRFPVARLADLVPTVLDLFGRATAGEVHLDGISRRPELTATAVGPPQKPSPSLRP